MHKSTKYKTLRDLYRVLKREGIIGYSHVNNFRQYWLSPREKEGIIVCPRDATHKTVRMFTREQIDSFVEAFRPGSTGRWDYRNL